MGVEYGFLLCKPNAQQHHGTMIAEAEAAGLAVVHRCYALSPEAAELLARHFHRQQGSATTATSSSTSSITVNPYASDEADTHETANSSSDDDDELAVEGKRGEKDGARGANGSDSSRRRGGARPCRFTGLHHTPVSHAVLQDIMAMAYRRQSNASSDVSTISTPAPKLLSRNEGRRGSSSCSSSAAAATRELQKGGALRRDSVKSGPPQRSSQLPLLSSDADRLTGSWATTATTPPSPVALSSPPPPPPQPHHRVRFAVGGRGKAGEEVYRRHVEHLLYGGTCLALLMRGPHAISCLSALAGPQDPAEAVRRSPKSWTARFGTDMVFNAAYAPATRAETLMAVELIFPGDVLRLEYETSMSMSDDRPPPLQPTVLLPDATPAAALHPWTVEVPESCHRHPAHRRSSSSSSSGGSSSSITYNTSGSTAVLHNSSVGGGGGGAEPWALPPLTLSSLLPRLVASARPDEFVSFYTGRQSSSTRLREKAAETVASTMAATAAPVVSSSPVGVAPRQSMAGGGGRSPATVTSGSGDGFVAGGLGSLTIEQQLFSRQQRLHEWDLLLHQHSNKVAKGPMTADGRRRNEPFTPRYRASQIGVVVGVGEAATHARLPA